MPSDGATTAGTSLDPDGNYPQGSTFNPQPVSDGDKDDKPRRYVVANVEVSVLAERVQYFDANGRLITESLKDYTRKTCLLYTSRCV